MNIEAVEQLDDEDERIVLGAMMLSSEACDEVALILRPTDFRGEVHQCVYEAIQELRTQNIPVDAVNVVRALQSADRIGVVSVAALAEMIEAVPHARHADYHAKRVREQAIRRDIRYMANELPRKATDMSKDTSEILGGIEQDLHGLLERSVGTKSQMSFTEILVNALERSGAAVDEGVPSGFAELDKLTHGFQRGHLIVLGARPSVGKTALACNIVVNAAREGHSVMFVSLEQSSLQLAERLLSMESRVDSNVLRGGTINEDERGMLMEATHRLSQMKVIIDDEPGRTVNQIVARARYMKRRHALTLIVIDYLQIVEPHDRRVNREQQVATISRRLAILARQLEIPVLLLAQLNRDTEKSPDKKPKLYNLRESGALEQDANIVLLLHRSVVDDGSGKNPPTQATLIVAKNRDGDVGEIHLDYRPRHLKFVERERSPAWEPAPFQDADAF